MQSISDGQLGEMAITVPPEFISLGNISNRSLGKFVNVMGVLSDVMPPRKTRTNEWQSTLRLTDPSLPGQGLQVVFFNENQADVPTANVGDVMIISSAKINSYQGGTQLLSTKTRTDWILIPASSIVKPDQRKLYTQQGKCMKHICSSAADMPTVHQQQWAITLAHSDSAAGVKPTHEDDQAKSGSPYRATPSKLQQNPPVSIIQRPQKSCLIKDAVEGKFHDLIGQVVKIFHAGSSFHGDFVDLHLTDFTQRSGLHDYDAASARDWPGPYGRYTIKIECHEPHGSWIMNSVVPGDLLGLLNVRVKWNRDATFIEGNLFPDLRYPKKICAFKPLLEDRRIVDLLGRRKGYQTSAEKKGWTNLIDIPGQEPLQSVSELKPDLDEEPRKKKPKKAMKSSVEDEHIDMSSSYRETVKRQRDPNMNPSIAVSKSAAATALCKISDVVNNPARFFKVDGKDHRLPFVNCKYMLQMRVIDFYPHDIRDFCVFKEVRSPNKTEWKWLWAFYIIVRAAHDSQDGCNDHLIVEVSHREAEIFLGLKPKDLRARSGSQLYTDLIRKLRLLWGDLDEVKATHFETSKIDSRTCQGLVYDQGIVVNDNRPFEGCIAEFGQAASETMNGQEVDSTSEAGWHRDQVTLILLRILGRLVHTAQAYKAVSHALGSDLVRNARNVNLAQPVSSPVLEDIPRSEGPTSNMSHASVEGHALYVLLICTTMQDIIIVERHVTSFELHSELAGHVLSERIRSTLLVGQRTVVRLWHNDQASVIIQCEIPLCVEGRIAESCHLLLRGRCRRDVVSVPAQLKIVVWPYEQVVQLHDKLVLLAAVEELSDRLDDGVVKVGLYKQV
ncbi:hypothetical protein FH972_022634 [Carpinus fangiana]|uniref:Protection of telomeres protein 1 n=1 Tax=Carpinus fangiana TaxID=176857 RepID=A0A5N6KT49_9ROSI|nr:hypothetical protein FH972_022634 [Carpinus fangiana]